MICKYVSHFSDKISQKLSKQTMMEKTKLCKYNTSYMNTNHDIDTLLFE